MSSTGFGVAVTVQRHSGSVAFGGHSASPSERCRAPCPCRGSHRHRLRGAQFQLCLSGPLWSGNPPWLRNARSVPGAAPLPPRPPALGRVTATWSPVTSCLAPVSSSLWVSFLGPFLSTCGQPHFCRDFQSLVSRLLCPEASPGQWRLTAAFHVPTDGQCARVCMCAHVCICARARVHVRACACVTCPRTPSPACVLPSLFGLVSRTESSP